MIYCRKNQATLTASERARFVAAVLALKASGKYDQYVQWHIDSMSGGNMWAHRRPAFLPWHRQYLLDFENDLRAIDPTVTLPYWDWTVDDSPSSSIWNDDFMGGDGRPLDGRVMTGPFAYDAGNWTLVVDGPALRRRFGVSIATLPPLAEVNAALAQTLYDASPWSMSSTSGFRNFVEGWAPSPGPRTHNRGHVWVGGSMLPESSPNDPVFFLHHCFIDKLWADWQAAHPGAGYLPVSGGPAGHNLGDAMEPWAGLGSTVTPAAMLDHHALGYAYDTEGICAPITIKFLDDQPTLKFLDDRPTLKFIDDPATLKFADDQPTLKVFDDQPTLKVLDDQPTLKFADDPTLKFRDDMPTLKAIDDGPGTLKAIDDGPGTLKAIDDGPGTLKAIDDVKSPGLDPAETLAEGVALPGGWGASQAPFVLATPHHSMAWTETFPQAFQAAVQRLQTQLTNCHHVIAQREAAERQGALSEAEAQELALVREEAKSLAAEYEALVRQASTGRA
jgi:tyrosinase